MIDNALYLTTVRIYLSTKICNIERKRSFSKVVSSFAVNRDSAFIFQYFKSFFQSLYLGYSVICVCVFIYILWEKSNGLVLNSNVIKGKTLKNGNPKDWKKIVLKMNLGFCQKHFLLYGNIPNFNIHMCFCKNEISISSIGSFHVTKTIF